MGIMMTKDMDRDSDLNRRISADLRSRAQTTRDDIDGVDDSEYIKDTKKTGKFTWVWILLIILAIASLIFIVLG